MPRESESTNEAAHWELWRQDDNGARALVARFEDREAAHDALVRFESKRHKQTYWLEEKKSG